MRTFIAIKLPPNALLLQVIADLKAQLVTEPVKWVNTNSLHLTLKFLGETSPVQVAGVKAALTGLAASFRPFRIFPGSTGYFKSRGMPRVLYISFIEADPLVKLAGEIDRLLEPLGFEQEKRPYTPHLTLARIKYLNNKETFYKAAAGYKNLVLPAVTVGDVYYYQSTLTQSGPQYNELLKLPLAG